MGREAKGRLGLARKGGRGKRSGRDWAETVVRQMDGGAQRAQHSTAPHSIGLVWSDSGWFS